MQRRKKASERRGPRLKNNQILSYVISKLKEGWSPEQIAGRACIDHKDLSISYEAIYQYIYHPLTQCHQDLIGYLRRAHRKRKTKGIGIKERKTKIPKCTICLAITYFFCLS